MRKIALICLILLTSALGFAQGERNFIENNLYPAVGLLYSQTENGGMQMRCTVTAIERKGDSTVFATASHCACGDGTTIDRTTFFITSDQENLKKFMEAKPLACGSQIKGQDFAVFEVKTTDFPVIALGSDVKTHYGEQVVNVASPLGLGKQTFRGTVTSPKLARPMYDSAQHINWQDSMMLQLFGTNGGSSGSAIVCLEQRAICGFLVGTIADTEIIALQVSRFKSWYEDVKNGKNKQLDKEEIDALKDMLKQ